MATEDGPVTGSLRGERRGLLGRRRVLGNDIRKLSNPVTKSRGITAAPMPRVLNGYGLISQATSERAR